MRKPNLKEAQRRTKRPVKVIYDQYLIPHCIKDIGKNKYYYLRTYGCQMNVHDSETLRAILEELGYINTTLIDKADLILLNTCAIRENVHHKIFGFLGMLKKLKELKPNLILGICGCMAQEEVVVNHILERYQFVDFVLGTHNLHQLPNLLAACYNNKSLTIDVWSEEGSIIEGLPIKRDNPYKAWLNIIYGCDKFCTYCIVPFTRGKQRSRLKEDIIKEVKALVSKGYLEVTLLGQNVNAYGKDLKDGSYGMAELLNDISKTKLKRIRFLTSHPWDFNDDLIKVIKEKDNIMSHLHLPLQSGSNRILKLMGRRYTKESYLDLITKIKKNIPKVSITTDIIVGFPSESETDFLETLEMVKTCQFDAVYSFIYSPREGTAAIKIKDITTFKEKQIRLSRLNKLVNQIALSNNQKLIKKKLLVLIEGYSKKKNKLKGYTDTNKLVNVEGSKDYLGKIVLVKITKAKTWTLEGIVEDKDNN